MNTWLVFFSNYNEVSLNWEHRFFFYSVRKVALESSWFFKHSIYWPFFLPKLLYAKKIFPHFNIIMICSKTYATNWRRLLQSYQVLLVYIHIRIPLNFRTNVIFSFFFRMKNHINHPGKKSMSLNKHNQNIELEFETKSTLHISPRKCEFRFECTCDHIFDIQFH